MSGSRQLTANLRISGKHEGVGVSEAVRVTVTDEQVEISLGDPFRPFLILVGFSQHGSLVMESGVPDAPLRRSVIKTRGELGTTT